MTNALVQTMQGSVFSTKKFILLPVLAMRVSLKSIRNAYDDNSVYPILTKGDRSTEDAYSSTATEPTSEVFWVERRLLQSCDVHMQCNGTENANKCLPFEDVKLCYCNEGTIVFKDQCIDAGKKLFESCEFDVQCTGTESANICVAFRDTRKCSCKEGTIGFGGKCIDVGRKLNESCDFNVQCTGTENANNCTVFGGRKTCHCKKGTNRFAGKCIEVGRKLFESCDFDVQCNGTENANNCSTFGDRNMCFCNIGTMVFADICIDSQNFVLRLYMFSEIYLWLFYAMFLLLTVYIARKYFNLEKDSSNGASMILFSKENVKQYKDILDKNDKERGSAKVICCIEIDHKSKSKVESFFNTFVNAYTISWITEKADKTEPVILAISLISRMQDDMKKVAQFMVENGSRIRTDRILLLVIHNCHKDNTNKLTLCESSPHQNITKVVNLVVWKNEIYHCDININASESIRGFIEFDRNTCSNAV